MPPTGDARIGRPVTVHAGDYAGHYDDIIVAGDRDEDGHWLLDDAFTLLTLDAEGLTATLITVRDETATLKRPEGVIGRAAILAGPTPAQADAALRTGPVLVLASAGTGKTKTLTAGVAVRVTERRIPVHRILAVTFTNKAAAEMRQRILALLRGQAAPGWPSSPAIETLRDTWLTAPNLAAQQSIAADIQRQAVQDTPYVQLGQTRSASAHRADLDGVVAGIPIFWNARRSA